MSLPTRRIVLVLLAAAAVYLAGNANTGLWDRDEPRYAQCARQMLESGDWVVPRLYDNLRAAKPPFIYWCQAISMKALGQNAFAARIPSVVAMLLTLIVLAMALRRHCGAQQALWTVFVFSSSALAVMAAKICLTDSVLVLFTTVAQLCLFRMWRGDRSWATAIVMAIALGLGGITKGPFILGTVAATLAALAFLRYVDAWMDRRVAREAAAPALADGIEPQAALLTAPATTNMNLAEHAGEGVGAPAPAILPSAFAAPSLPSPGVPGEGTNARSAHLQTGTSHPFSPPEERAPRFARGVAQLLVGTAIIAAIVLPWIILVNHRAPEFLGRILNEAREHMENGKEGHNYPPGFHLVMVWPMFLPWSLILPIAIGIGIADRKVAEVRFALAAVLGPWIMVEFLGTKLAHYFLSAYPALAFLTAYAIIRNLRRESRDLESRPFFLGALAWGAAIIGIGLLPWLPARTFAWAEIPWRSMIVLSLFAIGYVVGVLALLHTKRLGPALALMGGGMFVFMALLCGVYFPHARFLRISEHVADVLKRHGATHKGDVLMVDYKEPSLGFYQGGTIRECKQKDLLARPFSDWPRWLVITRAVWEKMTPAERDGLRVVDRYTGWAYADHGRVLQVMVVEKKQAAIG